MSDNLGQKNFDGNGAAPKIADAGAGLRAVWLTHNRPLDDPMQVSKLIDTLILRFPAVYRLAGRDLFSTLARGYTEGEGRTARLFAEFGATFSSFIEGHRAANNLPYLPDLARFEWLRWLARLAPGRPPISGRELLAAPAEEAPSIVLETHPSLGIIASPFSVISIWETRDADEEARRTSLRRGWEEAMILRPASQVRVLRMPPGAYQFIDKLRKGARLIAALEAASDWTPQFDMRTTLKWFVQSGAVTGYRPAKGV